MNKDRAYRIEPCAQALTLREAYTIVEQEDINLFDPTNRQAVALCVTSLHKRALEANRLSREGKKSGYTDREYDSLEMTLMLYCTDYDSLL